MAICASQVDGIEEHHDDVVGAGLPVADDQAGEIDRKEARSVQHSASAETHQRADGDERAHAALAAAPGG